MLPLALAFFGLDHLVVLSTLGVTVLAAYWGQGFDLEKWEYLVFPLPVVLVVVNIFLLSYFTDYGLPITDYRGQIAGILDLKIGLLLIVEAAILYITFLTLNILNAATVRTVPLKKAALSTLYFLSLLLTFTFGYVLWKEQFLVEPRTVLSLVALKGGILASWVFAVAVLFLYYATEKLRVLESSVLALVVGELAVASAFWPAQSLIRVIFITGSAFMILGVLQHSLNRDLSKKLRREYLWVGLILVFAFLLG